LRTAARRRLLPLGWNRSARASLPYVVNVCFNCFERFRGTLQSFHMDVAKVDRGMLHMLYMLQVF
jgi:hypothetical protein